jgi:hypothetical protein
MKKITIGNISKGVLGLFVGLITATGSISAQEISAERLEEMVTYFASDEMLGRGFGSEEGKQAAAYIVEQFKNAEISPFLEDYLMPFDHRTGVLNIKGNNVVGFIEGSDPELKDQYIILGAHYDHVGWKIEEGDTVVYNGADDNASGVASIIEIARFLNQSDSRPGRSILFIAFDGEESGLVGSKAFVRKMIKQDSLIGASDIVAMFSLDMVGMYEAHKGVELRGIGQLDNSEEFLAGAMEMEAIEIIKETSSTPLRTDTAPFGELGIPSIHVFTGTESPYHKPEDDSELLDYEGMAKIASFIANLTSDLAVSRTIVRPETTESGEIIGKKKRIKAGLMVNMGGTHHDYKNDYYLAKGVFAYGAGFMVEAKLARWLAFQPEVLYEWTGSQELGGNLRTHSVTVPVSFLLTSPQGGGASTYFQAGAYYSYAFAGSQAGTDLDFAVDFNDTDYGLILGFGFDISKVRIGMVFTDSFVDFSSSDPRDTRKKGSFARIGWTF